MKNRCKSKKKKSFLPFAGAGVAGVVPLDGGMGVVGTTTGGSNDTTTRASISRSAFRSV